MAKLIGREGERLAFLSTAVGAAGAKVVVGFTVRDGAAPVELTEITRVSVVARMNAYEIRHGCRADRRRDYANITTGKPFSEFGRHAAIFEVSMLFAGRSVRSALYCRNPRKRRPGERFVVTTAPG